jgi:O-succinylbenzoic acid--CoA ligase
MSYLDFVNSLSQNRIHFVSGKSHSIKGFGVIQEPVYALETSGSVQSKIYLHNLSSVEGSCEAFLATFDLTSNDRWGLCLSTAHVAGFSVLARTYFGKLKEPYFFEWSKENLVDEVEKNQVSILSLVPTQIFDLVEMCQSPPGCLRMVFVGGAKLSKELRDGASKLGWPLIECYGSTETFAQMSYSIDGKGFKTFDGWTAKIEDRELVVSGPGLFMGKVKAGVFRSRTSEWFKTGDLVFLNEGGFEILGKKTGLIKIKGSYFDFNKLKSDFQKVLISKGVDPATCFLICLKEERDGAGVYMISTNGKIDITLLTSFKDIRGVFYLKSVDRSALGKVKASSLSSVLKKTVLSL